MTRVIHTGDTHVGYRQYHSPERRRDFLEAFRRVVTDAVEADVDAVVHAGDLFNDRRPDLQDLLGTISVLETLREAGIPFLAIVGNHEDARRGQWLDLFERLDLATHLDEGGTQIGDTTFYGLDYVPESKRDSLEYQFDPADTAHTALVGHGLFSPFPHGDWDLEAILERTNIDFDAVLLGDDHTPETKQVAETWVTYCGSTERTSAAEREARGYNLVEFDGEVSITRRGLDTRNFVFIDVELEATEGAAYVRERIRESSVDDAVVIVTVEGDGESITPAEIESFGQDQGALVTRVNDRREFDDESEIEVSFADPDDAVRDRIREMGLSEAARAVDEVVREEEIARTNVRGRVTEQIEELLDEPESFQSVAAEEKAESGSGETVGGDSSPELAGDTAIEAVEDTQGETAADTQGETAADTQSETAADIQSETAADIQSETAADTQSETAADIVTDAAGDSPADSPAEPPAESDADSERGTAEERPAGTEAESAAESDEETDSESDTSEDEQELRETTMEDFL